MKVDVLIVGAGPAGLVAANLLVRNGASVRVIDAAPGITEQSRANLVQVRSLELWDKLGLAESAIAHGRRLVATRVWAGGKVLTDLPSSGRALLSTPFPFALGYEQWKTQRLLADALGGGIEWNTRVVGLDQSEDGVTAQLVTEDGAETTAEAAWGIGADGVRSTVRALLEVPFEGGTYGQIGFLADVDMEFGITVPEDRVNIFVAPIGTVGFVKHPERGRAQYRLFGTVTPGLRTALEASRDAIGAEELQRWFDEQFLVPGRIERCDWYHSYRLHHKMAAQFHCGRWFLAGDAAHAHPPSGGQGANLSMGDGYDLGWKLGLVTTGQAHPALLESYEAERRPAARSIMSRSDKGFSLEAAVPAWRRIRQWLLPTALRVVTKIPAAREAPGRLLSQQRLGYRASPAVAGDPAKGGGPRPGDRAPDAVLGDGSAGRRLYESLRGVDHHLLLLQANAPITRFAELVADAAALAEEYRITIRTHTFGREHTGVHKAYRAATPTVVLIRPDGHIGYQGPLADPGRLREHLDRWYVRG